jgi:hypothetical protein
MIHASIAEREGWQCYCCERGAGSFHVMEVWIKNTGMVESLISDADPLARGARGLTRLAVV